MTPNPEPTIKVTPVIISSNKDKKFSRIYPECDDDQVVISGMSGKFPNSRNVQEYSQNLFHKVDMVDDDERRWRHFNPEIPKRSGKLYDLEKFDATFFGVHFKQAHTMDPQCRILMEVAYEAVIDAGINPKTLRGSRTGVYVGSCISESEKTWFYEKVSSGGFGITGCSRAMLANRISYALGLNGPSYLLDTACSSSMYALDNAFTALRNGEIDAAIIGGANLLLHPFVTLQFARLGVLAPNGYCRPFDKDATGYTRSEAINCLFLQRKRDAKRIYAEVIYSKTNCDGYKPEGITYPSGNTQEQLLREFYADVDIRPNDLGYLEAHSTGTIVGDPEECRAIDNVLCSQRKEPLLVGSVKSNVGHSEAASGICSLVKAILAFETGKIPPNINFSAIKEEIPALAEGRLKVVNDVEVLHKPYIGVNSFGFGGANAHALLKACSKEKTHEGLPFDDIPRIVGWAGRNEKAVVYILDSIEKRPLDAEYVALLHNIQREEVTGMVSRGFGIYAKNGYDNATCLMKEVQHFSGIKRPLVWVFSGMGSQWTQMGSSLMEIPIFRNSIERCHQALLSKGLNLIEILTSTDKSTFDNILHSFVGIAAIQIGLVDMLRALNLEPDYIIGHSVGELGCGYADGGFTPEQMITAAYYRGKVSLEIKKIHGSMAAIGLGYKDIIRLVPESIEVACHNGFDSSTISGPSEDVARFVAELKAKGIFAKEVPCSNIAYHSRYIAHMGPQLLKYLKETIPHPKQRSSKWLSSSVPKSEWEQAGRDLCSAEYHTNNLLSSVLFEETFAMLPNNALTIEIAPHGLLQAILKRSMPGGVHVPLTQRGNKNNSLFALGALGKLFNNGITLPFENLYPRVQFPVSRGTPGISSLIKWDHSEDWFVTKYENMKTKSSGERVFNVNLKSDDEEFLGGHVIDGKILVPATCYLQYVWETFSLMYHGPSYMDVSVEFEDVRFLRATNLTMSDNVELTVMIHYGTGNFEVTESNTLVVTGNIKELDNPPAPVPLPIEDSEFPMMSQKDFYKELKLRGYHYNGAFKAVNTARSDGLYGKIEWVYNWVTFMDAMLQIHIVGTDSRTLFLPTKIRKLRINGKHHFNLISQIDTEEKLLEVYANPKFDRVVAGGVEMEGLHASPVQRKKPPGIPVLEKYQFVPHFPSPQMTTSDAARVCVQLGLENVPVMKMKVVEVDTEAVNPIVSYFLDAVEDLPLVTGDYMLLSDRTLDLPGIHVENGKLSTQTNCYFIIAKNLLKREEIFITAKKSLVEGGFLVARQTPEEAYDKRLSIPAEYKLSMIIPTTDDEVILLLQKQKTFKSDPVAIQVSVEDKEFSWITTVQAAIANGPVVLYAQNEMFNGLIGLVNCLRKEPDGHLVRCVFIDDKSAPPFDLENPFYKNQLSLGLGINVFREGQWGTYRHLQLISEELVLPRADHVYGNVIHRGDLSSLRWFEGQLKPKDCQVKVVYSSLNFRDVMLATGRLAVELNGSSRMILSQVLGFEYSGINTRTGKRIMSMCIRGGLASYVEKPGALVWEVPEKWSLEEAATIPVVYITVYYAFFMSADIRKGKSILIHAGTGGIGLAAIRVALAYGLEVFTTVSTPQKRAFLLTTFPQLKDSHIGHSRDTSFETMIQRETDGNGVDFVLNSLSEDKLMASVRCLGQGGHFLEIGKFDMANDSKLGMAYFLKELTFHAVLADTLIFAPDDKINKLKAMIDDDISGGIIQPLPITVFPANELEQGFRHLIGGKHIGKVLIKMRDDPETPYTVPVPVIRQVYFNPEHSYVIPGGLGGFGLELADWMAIRGARKLVLSSSRGITKDYQRYRIALWKTYGCTVLVSTADITTREGCETLLKEANNLGPVGGIFNLAVALRDAIFSNQTVEKFQESFAPKALATQYLDELSRKLCPILEHFIVFSSVSCGRGNAGQTNYGMANSVMERIVESRVANGLPGKAVQWGAVGEVGLVADMAEDKIDMEIGGTLQQRISSCLQELDNLLSSSDSIVASMVVAEKRVGRGGNENIIETVMNIMGMRDLKSVSLSTTLSEMGMDSLMAVEIKQTLERDFELCLSPQDLRSLTFQKLQEYTEAREREGAEVVKLILASENKPLGMNLLLRNLGDEATCNTTLLSLLTSADASKLNLNPSIVIPGLEGTVGAAWYAIGKRLQSKSVVLQLHQTAGLTSVKEVTEAVLEKIKSVLKTSEMFYIIGYSFGTFVALQVASLLEKSGYRGQLLLIDGAPHFLKKLTLGHLGENFQDEDLHNLLFSGIVSQIFPDETTESASAIFLPLKTYEEKMAKLMEFVKKQKVYSDDYAKTMVKAMFNRVKMAAYYDLDSLGMLNSPITLVRPSEVSMQDVDEDYCLSKLTKGKVTVKFVEGNHTTMLDNPNLAQLINDFDPALQDDKNFEEYLKDVKPVKVKLEFFGTGGIGLAAIRVALAYGLEVFTTVSTPQKRAFLLTTFPQLKDSHIGHSRDTSFETMIQRETDGNGVDFVLNSLSEDKLMASVRCLGQGGHFLEIGKFDMANDSKLGMAYFLKELTFHAVLADTLIFAPDDKINKLKAMIDDDISGGIIQPLPITVFPANELEQGFRHLIGGKHIGKVLVKMRDDLETPYTVPVPVIRQVYFNPEHSYVIPGGLGGFGLELADWMAIRGARKLVLSSSRGITKDYQRYRIALWKTYGCTVLVSTADITTREGCETLLKEANNLGPVGGIFNLAVALRDAIFSNLTVEKFQESFAPKALATQYLDELSRKLCPILEHFIVFSSVSCGRGNAGQTNYGMANSVMERIVESRVANGLPGKAVQWGAVGEVGLVADMAEDKIDMEIGGTLQQRISSCLQELDNLLSSSDSIVASMVVAEKRVGRGGNENIIETVMNIMGMRDLKSVSLSTTLSEMGMDSLMAVEVKQTLERDFELCLSPQDLRSLTFQKLQEYTEAREREGAEVVKLILASENKPLGMNLLLRNLGDEATCNTTLLSLLTSADASKLNLNPSIVIPGLEGTVGAAWYAIGKRLQSKSVVLQLHQTAGLTSVKEVTEAVLEKIKSVLKTSEMFYIIGYSFGTFVALQVASLLEKSGYRGQLLLIDGAPHFLKKLTLGHLGENFQDEDLHNLLFSGIVSQIFPDETTESASAIFLPLKTYEEKMAKLMEFVKKQKVYSDDYAKTMVKAMFNRVKMAAYYDLDSLGMLNSPITLVRPSEVSMQDVDEDYCLSKLTKGKVTVKFVEGNHTTMLDNPNLAQLINDFDPALQDDKNFEEYLKDVKPVKVV